METERKLGKLPQKSHRQQRAELGYEIMYFGVLIITPSCGYCQSVHHPRFNSPSVTEEPCALGCVFSSVTVPTTPHRQLPAPPTLISDRNVSYEAETTSVSQHLCGHHCLIYKEKILDMTSPSHKSFYNNFHKTSMIDNLLVIIRPCHLVSQHLRHLKLSFENLSYFL